MTLHEKYNSMKEKAKSGWDSLSRKARSGWADAKTRWSSLSQKARDKFAHAKTGVTARWNRFKSHFDSPKSKGGRGTRKRQAGGNFHAMTPNHGLASTASRVSGTPYAKAHYVGGKGKCKKHHRHTSKCQR